MTKDDFIMKWLDAPKKCYIEQMNEDLDKVIKAALPQANVSGSAPTQECYKTGEPCKYGCSGLCKESC